MALSTRVILEISWEVPKSLRRCEILIDEPLKIPFPKICKQAFSRNPRKSPGKSCSQEFLGIISHGDYMSELFSGLFTTKVTKIHVKLPWNLGWRSKGQFQKGETLEERRKLQIPRNKISCDFGVKMRFNLFCGTTPYPYPSPQLPLPFDFIIVRNCTEQSKIKDNKAQSIFIFLMTRLFSLIVWITPLYC